MLLSMLHKKGKCTESDQGELFCRGGKEGPCEHETLEQRETWQPEGRSMRTCVERTLKAEEQRGPRLNF